MAVEPRGAFAGGMKNWSTQLNWGQVSLGCGDGANKHYDIPSSFGYRTPTGRELKIPPPIGFRPRRMSTSSAGRLQRGSNSGFGSSNPRFKNWSIFGDKRGAEGSVSSATSPSPMGNSEDPEDRLGPEVVQPSVGGFTKYAREHVGGLSLQLRYSETLGIVDGFDPEQYSGSPHSRSSPEGPEVEQVLSPVRTPRAGLQPLRLSTAPETSSPKGLRKLRVDSTSFSRASATEEAPYSDRPAPSVRPHHKPVAHRKPSFREESLLQPTFAPQTPVRHTPPSGAVLNWRGTEKYLMQHTLHGLENRIGLTVAANTRSRNSRMNLSHHNSRDSHSPGHKISRDRKRGSGDEIQPWGKEEENAEVFALPLGLANNAIDRTFSTGKMGPAEVGRDVDRNSTLDVLVRPEPRPFTAPVNDQDQKEIVLALANRLEDIAMK